MATFTPIQGAITVAGLNPTIFYANIAGRGFTQNVVIEAEPIKEGVVTGRSFGSNAIIYGAAVVEGKTFKTTPVINISFTYDGYVTGSTFRTAPTINAIGSSDAAVSGRGFKVEAAILGGAVVTGYGFNTAPTISGLSSETATVTGRGFSTTPIIQAIYQASATVTGRGFKAGLFQSSVTGRGFSTDPTIIAEFTAEYAEAFVMNLSSNQVSRYQNYPFIHITKIGSTYYGVQSDGLYELTGVSDADSLVNGTVLTKDMDYGTFHSKNTPYLYINGDDTYTVTAYVDSVEQPPFVSGFSGRRVKLARGNKGRYWAFKVEGVNKLQGLEFMPDELSRRVK